MVKFCKVFCRVVIHHTLFHKRRPNIYSVVCMYVCKTLFKDSGSTEVFKTYQLTKIIGSTAC